MGAGHLRNTRIISNKPIAVNSSDDSVGASSGGQGGADLIGEQIVPITLAGNTFIAIWNNNSYESVFIFPTQNNTNIYINGNTTPVATLNIGDEYMYTLTTSATLITSDKPVFVFELTGCRRRSRGNYPSGFGLYRFQRSYIWSSELFHRNESYHCNPINQYQRIYSERFTGKYLCY